MPQLIILTPTRIQQTYPQNAQFPAKDLKNVDMSGTQSMSHPTLDASVAANGELTMHLKPTVTFGIVFDARWKVPDCSVNLVLDGYVTFHALAAASLNGDNSCLFSYGIDAGANVFAQLNAPDLFGWGGNQQFNLGPPVAKTIVDSTCVLAGSTSRRDLDDTPLIGLPSANNGTSNGPIAGDQHRPVLVGNLDVDPPAPLYDSGLGKRDQFNVGPLITLPAGFLSCPAESGANGTLAKDCPICGTSSIPPSGFKKRAENLGSLEEASCPLMTPPEDNYCIDDTVQKRDGKLEERGSTSPKKMTLPWVSSIIFSTYYPCSKSASQPATLRWFTTQGQANGGTCDPTLAQVQPDGGGLVAGLPPSSYAGEHVFEPQLVSAFFFWLCGVPNSPYNQGPIPWPAGWGRADVTWCGDVFGNDDANTGFQFGAYTGDNNHANFINNAGTVLGGIVRTDLMTIYQQTPNGMKGAITNAKVPALGGLAAELDTTVIQNFANVFQYLANNQVKQIWLRPANSIETIAAHFDAIFWNSGFAARGTPLTRPVRPTGVTTWGMRTLWAYWIDNHLARCERNVADWLGQARQRLQNSPAGLALIASNFMQPGGMMTAAQMRFPQPNPAAPLPGQNSAGSTQSRYGMWGGTSDAAGAGVTANNAYGPLGI